MKGFIPELILCKNEKNLKKGMFNGFALFADISGFTLLTEEMMKKGRVGAERVSKILNDSFSEMVEAVHSRNGLISTFAGDAFTAIFKEDEFSECLECAFDLIKYFENKENKKDKFFGYSISLKIGIGYGNIDWGIVGKELKNYYFSSDAVDRAAAAEKELGKQEIGIHSSVNLEFLKNCVFEKRNSIYLIKEYKNNKSNSIRIESVEINESPFLHKDILSKNLESEFRSVVSIFILFNELKTYKEINISYMKIIKLTEKYKGYLSLLDFGDKGSKVMIILGAPKSYENDLKRAVKFSLEVMNVFDNKPRIGLTYATSFAGKIGGRNRATYTVIGSSVNLAARLMSAAKEGEILTDIDTAENVKHYALLENKGEMLLKGFQNNVKVIRIIKEKEFSSDRFENEMIGRKRELNQILEFASENKNNPSMIRIEGDAGIGKSRLLSEAVKLLKERRITVLYGECDEMLKESFNPIKQMFRRFFFSDYERVDNEKEIFEEKFNKIVNKTKSREIKEELERTLTISAGIMGIEYNNSLYSKMSGSNLFQNTILAVKSLVEALAEENTVVLALEDAHNLDRDSFSALKKIIEFSKKLKIIIITTERPKDSDDEVTLERILCNKISIKMNVLSESEIKQILKTMLRGHPEEKLLSLISEKSEGNPFYVEQITYYLMDNMLIKNDSGIMRLASESIEMPDNIQSMIVSRVDSLSDEVRSIIKTASVLGRRFSATILSDMLKRRDLKYELKKSDYASVISPLSEIFYIFKHAIIRDSLYQLQMKDKIKEMHILAGECIENAYKKNLSLHSAELAYHFENGEDSQKSEKYLLAAGERAVKKYMNQSALEYYRRSLKHSKDIKRIIKTHEIIGNIYEHFGKWDESLEEYFKWMDAALKENLYDNYIGMNTKSAALLGQRGQFDEAQKNMDNAYNCLKNTKNNLIKAGYFNILGTINYYKGDLKKSRDGYEKFLGISKKSGMTVNVGRGKINLGMIQMMQGNMKEAENNYLEGIDILKKANEILTLGQGYMQLGNLYFMTKRYKSAKKMYLKRLVVARKYGDRQGEAYCLGNLGNLVKTTGDFDSALESFRKCYSISEEIGDMNSMMLSMHALANVYKEKGEIKEAMEMYKQTIAMLKEYNFQEHLLNTYKNMGEINFTMGKHDEAIDQIVCALEIAKKEGFASDEVKLLNSLSKIWFEKEDYFRAELFNKESECQVQKTDDKKAIFDYSLMKGKIIFIKDSAIGVQYLNGLVKEFTDEEDVAFVIYNLFKLTKKEEYKIKALKLFRKLFKKTKEFEHGLIIKLLEEVRK